MRQVFTGLSVVFTVLAFSFQLPGQEVGRDDRQVVEVMGQVVGEDDKPVAEAIVQEISWKEGGAPLKTDNEGRFTIRVETGPDGRFNAAFLARTADGRIGFVSASKPTRISFASS